MAYIPDRGDAVWISFDPQAGREQAGRRPAVILSPKFYNGRSNLGIMCPITNQIKGYPFEVLIPEGLDVTGVVLADQARNLDWNARKIEKICELPDSLVMELLRKLRTLL